MRKIDAVLAAMLVWATAACASPTADLTRSARSGSADDSADSDEETPKKTTHKTAAAAASTDEDSEGLAPAPAASTTPDATPAPKPTAIDVTYAASANQMFDTVHIYRSCSDLGVDYNMADVADATALSLVDVKTNHTLVTVDGADFKALQKSLVNGDGTLHIEVPGADVPAAPNFAEYALIAHGDSRFGSPAACGVSLAPQSDKDRGVKGGAGNFPTGRVIAFTETIAGSGCGTVGYLQAYYDAANGVIVARPSSPIIIAADDEGKGGFSKGSGTSGCDAHDSPLVLDLGASGVRLSRARSDVFDIDGDGRRDAISWVASSDTPFLVRDANGNGTVDGATELFGNHTNGAANGFDALARYDVNGDGVIDVQDPVWSSLRLWFDRDGRSGALETLESRGVQAIATGYVSTKEQLAGGSIRQRGGATMTDGRIVPVVDVWFDRDL